MNSAITTEQGSSAIVGLSYILTVDLKVMDKIMERIVKDTHFLINTDMGHHLPVIQLDDVFP